MKKAIIPLCLAASVLAASATVSAEPMGRPPMDQPPVGHVYKRLDISRMERHEINHHVYFHDSVNWYLYDPVRTVYVVVDEPQRPRAPMMRDQGEFGEVLTTLPPGAVAVMINGVQYFEKQVRLYLPTQRHGQSVYVHVNR